MEVKLAYYDVEFQYFSHYATGTPQSRLEDQSDTKICIALLLQWTCE